MFIYQPQQIKYKEMIRDMLSVQELLAGRRLHSAGSKQPRNVFRLIQDWRTRVVLLSRWQLTSKNLHLSAAVTGVILISCVSKRPYQKSTQVSAGKLETVSSWQDINAGS